MSQRCAQILNGVVTNVIVADPSFSPGDGSIIVQSDTAQIGWAYANGAFTPVVAPVVNQTTGLTFLQFMTLFTPSEQVAIMNSTDPQVKLFCFQAAASDDIMLTDARVVAGVQYLVSASLLTAARAAVVLSGAAHS